MQALKMHIVRALNAILARPRTKNINPNFKVKLPSFVTEYLPTEKRKIFENVSEETLFELKKGHDDYLQKKGM